MRSKDWILTHCTKDWRWNEAEEGAEKKWPIGLEKSTRGEGNISELNHRYTLHQCHIFIFVLFLCKLKALVENGRSVHRITLYYVCNFLWICYYFKIFFKSFKSLVKKKYFKEEEMDNCPMLLRAYERWESVRSCCSDPARTKAWLKCIQEGMRKNQRLHLQPLFWGVLLERGFKK